MFKVEEFLDNGGVGFESPLFVDDELKEPPFEFVIPLLTPEIPDDVPLGPRH